MVLRLNILARMLERPFILQYHGGDQTMTSVEVEIFSADHFLAAVDLRSLASPPFEEHD